MYGDVLFHDHVEDRPATYGLAAGSALTQLCWLAVLHRITFASADLTTSVALLPWMFVVVGGLGLALSAASVLRLPSTSSNPLRAAMQGGLLFTISLLRMCMLHFCGLQWASLVESASFCLTEPFSKPHKNLNKRALIAIAAGYILALLFPAVAPTPAPPSFLFHIALFAASIGLKHVQGSFFSSAPSIVDQSVTFGIAAAAAFATQIFFGSFFSNNHRVPVAESHVYSSAVILVALSLVGFLSIHLPIAFHDMDASRQARLNVSVRLFVQYPLALYTCWLAPFFGWHLILHTLLSFGALVSISWGWALYLDQEDASRKHPMDLYSTSHRSGASSSSSALSFTYLLKQWHALDGATRKILLFLSGNILYMFVEFVVGYMTNSLGLLSDAGHMLFDNGALVIGLVAAMVSKWPASRQFTYGFDRVEVLSGFVNSLLLVFMAFHFMMEAVERIFDPPTIHTDHLLLTSVGGLLMNVVGLIWFHDLTHGHSHDSHDHGHSHSHGNSNLIGVYLHVLADTMGSVGVIISSICIDWYGWYIMDPLCSGFISIVIFGSTVPLLKETMTQLVQGIDASTAANLQMAVARIEQLNYVEHVSNVHAWNQSGKLIASMHVQVQDGTLNHQKNALDAMRSIVYQALSVHELTVQIVDKADAANIALGSHGHDHGHSHGHGHSHSHGHSHGEEGCSR
ncbi:hypothetical protein AC1031_002406 [Aphanomyces cochlioides]|nr:hypothetical protein AC1031_002406 [Aphanomyces cochlioides]